MSNWSLVSSLGRAINSGEHGLDAVPDLLKKTLETEAWREFLTPLRKTAHHERFIDFITTPPAEGLGASVDSVRRLASGRKDVLDLLDRALQIPNGGDRRSEDFSLDNIQTEKVPAPSGTSESAALRRLRKDRPDLHSEVIEGNLKAHAAMVQAGFRPKTFTVRADRPESIAQALRKQLAPDVLRRLVELLETS